MSWVFKELYCCADLSCIVGLIAYYILKELPCQHACETARPKLRLSLELVTTYHNILSLTFQFILILAETWFKSNIDYFQVLAQVAKSQEAD